MGSVTGLRVQSIHCVAMPVLPHMSMRIAAAGLRS